MDIDKVWENFISTRDADAKNELVLHYFGLVEKVVKRMMPVYGQYVEYDDMVGYGVIGLIDAIDKFEPSKNVKFETYSQLRIRGEIIDNIRRLDWAPVSLRSKIKLINMAYDELSADGNQDVTDEEVAAKLKMDVTRMRKIQASNSMFNTVCLEEVLFKASNESSGAFLNSEDIQSQPSEAVEQKELVEILANVISELPKNEQMVIQLHYFEEFMIKDIAKILDVSESRVSQIHSKALETLNRKLKRIYDFD